LATVAFKGLSDTTLHFASNNCECVYQNFMIFGTNKLHTATNEMVLT